MSGCNILDFKNLAVNSQFTLRALTIQGDGVNYSIMVQRFLATVSCPCYSQVESQVRVRVLDYRTGRPVQRHTVGLLLPDSEGQIRNDSPTLLAKTGRDGIAAFRISKPLPLSIWVLPEHS